MNFEKIYNTYFKLKENLALKKEAIIKKNLDELTKIDEELVVLCEQLKTFDIQKLGQDFTKEEKEKLKELGEEIKKLENNNEILIKHSLGVINNILSLVIRSELKEGANSQRVIIQTYNYNLTTDKEVKLSELLDIKNISKFEANKQIKTEIEKKKEQNEQLKELGYNMYIREYNSEIHDIENTTEFFIDEEGNLYLVYAYGNNAFTSEMDVIEI